MKILLTGGTGLLGQEILSLDSNILSPTRKIMNINDSESCLNFLILNKPDILIHAAAFTSPPKCESSSVN